MPHRLTILLAAMAALTVYSGPASGGVIHRSVAPEDLARMKTPEPPAPWRPSVSDFERLYLDPPPGPAGPAPEFLHDSRYAFPTRQKILPVSVMEGHEFHDLDKPRIKRHWWKYPVYAVAGFPRDAVDALFGFVGYIPPFNLVFTGAYELSGAQYLMRHPDDFHEYGGYANENAHGWIGGESWGWFSNARQTTFKEVDEVRLARMRADNEAIERALDAQNQDIVGLNEEIERDARAYLETAKQDFVAGRIQDALGRLWNYCLNRPTDSVAQAYYVAACAAQPGNEASYADWGEREIRRIVSSWPSGQFPAAIAILKEHLERRPSDLAARRWLAAFYGCFGSHNEALEEGRRAAADPRAGLRENELLFELALRRAERVAEADRPAESHALLRDMEAAAGRMARMAPRSPEARLASARLFVMKGQYAEGIRDAEALALEYSEDVNFAYHAGASHILQGLFGSAYDRGSAVSWMKRASTLEGASPRRRIEIAEALERAPGIRAAPAPRIPSIAE